MSSTPGNPIQIRVPPTLAPLAVPLSTWLEKNPTFTNLAVGACIFAPTVDHPSDIPQPRLLLVQRAAGECGFPNLWEVPGGSAEIGDPTILHSVAREVFEETGLMLTRFVRAAGNGIQFTTGSDSRWMKLTFEIEVQEDVLSAAADGEYTPSTRFDNNKARCITGNAIVKLDPAEHQAFKWVTEEELKVWGPENIVVEEQRQMMLQAFEAHKASKEPY